MSVMPLRYTLADTREHICKGQWFLLFFIVWSLSVFFLSFDVICRLRATSVDPLIIHTNKVNLVIIQTSRYASRTLTPSKLPKTRRQAWRRCSI